MFSNTSAGSDFGAAEFGRRKTFMGGRLLRAALQHPFGIVILASTTALALAMFFEAPFVSKWSGAALQVLLWGGFCFGVAVIAISRTRPTPKEPEMRDLETVRRMISGKIKERKKAEGWSRSAVTRSLEEVHEQLERRIMPAMQDLLHLQAELTEYLQGIEDSDIAPEAKVLRRLKDLHSRREATIAECVLQASNAAATLIEMVQEQGQAEGVDVTEGWAREPLEIYEAILQAMRPTQTAGETPSEPDPVTETTTPKSPIIDLPLDEAIEKVDSGLHEALRRLNRAPQLSACELMKLIPGTVERHWHANNPEASMPPTPLELAGSLYSILVAEIEQLKPKDGVVNGSNPAAEHYIVLHEHYVLGRKIDHIAVRLHIGERACYQRRKDAVEVMAMHLTTKELHLHKRPQKLLRQVMHSSPM